MRSVLMLALLCFALVLLVVGCVSDSDPSRGPGAADASQKADERSGHEQAAPARASPSDAALPDRCPSAPEVGADSGTTAAFVDSGQRDASVAAGPAIDRVEIQENPHNALSVYVFWRTDRPVVSEVCVTCEGEPLVHLTGQQPRTVHDVFVMGLIAGASCDVMVVAEGSDGAITRHESVYEVPALPSFLPEPSLELPASPEEARADDRIAPGWILTNIFNQADSLPLVIAMLDNSGRYRWYRRMSALGTGVDNDVRVVPEGVLVGGTANSGIYPVVLDWQGRVQWRGDFVMHHHIAPSLDGKEYLYLSRAERCDPNNRTDAVNAYDIELGTTVWTWSTCENYTPPVATNDWDHLNTIEQFPDAPQHLLISLRNQNQLFKIDRATGGVLWRLGRGGDFQMASKDEFLWQHAQEFQDGGTLLLFDNGLEGEREYSRVIEIAVDEAAMTAEVVWEYRHSPDLFSRTMGDADRQFNGNVLITFTSRTRTRGTAFVEVTREATEIWHLELPPRFDSYRAERVVEPPQAMVLGE